MLFLEKQGARPQHTQHRSQNRDSAAVDSTLSKAHSQSHNPSGLARTTLYKLQLPCLATLNLPNSHGTFLPQRPSVRRLQWLRMLDPKIQHPRFLPLPPSSLAPGTQCRWEWLCLEPAETFKTLLTHSPVYMLLPLCSHPLKPFSVATLCTGDT